MRPIIFGLLFPTITIEIRTFHFRTSMGDNFSKLSINFHKTYEKGVVDIDTTMTRDISIWWFFFSTKTMRIMKIHFGDSVGKYDP